MWKCMMQAGEDYIKSCLRARRALARLPNPANRERLAI
jgi:hypothetical protein